MLYDILESKIRNQVKDSGQFVKTYFWVEPVKEDVDGENVVPEPTLDSEYIGKDDSKDIKVDKISDNHVQIRDNAYGSELETVVLVYTCQEPIISLADVVVMNPILVQTDLRDEIKDVTITVEKEEDDSKDINIDKISKWRL